MPFLESAVPRERRSPRVSFPASVVPRKAQYDINVTLVTLSVTFIGAIFQNEDERLPDPPESDPGARDGITLV
jgi:hypothetical protein